MRQHHRLVNLVLQVLPLPIIHQSREQFLDAVGAVGARTYLAKAGHAFDGQTLTIYAGKKFAKMQIDRALPTLSAALNRLGITAEIAVLATSKPPKDRQKAAILAMMGGGEEITIDG